MYGMDEPAHLHLELLEEHWILFDRVSSDRVGHPVRGSLVVEPVDKQTV